MKNKFLLIVTLRYALHYEAVYPPIKTCELQKTGAITLIYLQIS